MSKLANKRRASPSPSGRRWREAPDEGGFNLRQALTRRYRATLSRSRPVLITITKMLEMQAERRFPLLLQTETLFACMRFPALDKAGRLRRRRCRGGLIKCRKYLVEFGALRGYL